MIVIKRLEGSGTFIAKGKEFASDYRVVVSRTADRITNEGVATGLELPDIMEIQTASSVTLRMQDGQEVDVAFLGGRLDGPQRFMVNTRIAGF